MHRNPLIGKMFIVILMHRLCRSHNETSQCVSTLICQSSVTIILQFLNRKSAQFGLDRAHVFMVDGYFACKRESFFFVLFVSQLLSLYCLQVKADLFSARMTGVLFSHELLCFCSSVVQYGGPGKLTLRVLYAGVAS